ncbi:hypothetical protein D9M68_936140 [compost metagenome]
MLIFGAQVSPAARYAQADNRWFAEVLLVGWRVDETLEQVAVQLAEMIGCAEGGPMLVMLQ